MKTEIIKIDPQNIDQNRIKHAADVLKGGGLVAFPTETVYGLGANAMSERAVKGIFTAKGRPSDNPLIVHIADKRHLENLTSFVPAKAGILIENFWPGPLTLVMKKSAAVPDVITAKLDTVAVRMPAHPVALALIRESGIPIAAPSANISGKPSPTNAEHVIEDLYGKVDVIIDAGNVRVGVESTVLDLTVEPPVVLRPGGVTVEQLRDILGEVSMDPGLGNNSPEYRPRAPGMKYKHYSPNARVIIVSGEISKVVEKIKALETRYENEGLKVGILATEQTKGLYRCRNIISVGDRNNLGEIASNLFSAFREFDRIKVDIVLAEAVDNAGMGLAVMNRMSKAAGNEIIKV